MSHARARSAPLGDAADEDRIVLPACDRRGRYRGTHSQWGLNYIPCKVCGYPFGLDIAESYGCTQQVCRFDYKLSVIRGAAERRKRALVQEGARQLLKQLMKDPGRRTALLLKYPRGWVSGWSPAMGVA
jgi:hypothetical protein